MAHLATDLAVTLPEDRPGMLAQAISAVGNAGINIDGYAEMDGVVHVLTTDLASTRRVLSEAGFKVVTEQQVLLVPIEDMPGSAGWCSSVSPTRKSTCDSAISQRATGSSLARTTSRRSRKLCT